MSVIQLESKNKKKNKKKRGTREQTDGQSGSLEQAMKKVNRRLREKSEISIEEERQLSRGILPTSLWTHSRVNCQCDEESPVSQANHIWLVLMGGRLVTGSQETQATLISMPAKRAVCVRVCLCVCVVQIRGTDSLQLGVRAVCVRLLCLTQLDILTMLMRDQQRTIGEFHADFVPSRWHTMQC